MEIMKLVKYKHLLVNLKNKKIKEKEKEIKELEDEMKNLEKKTNCFVCRSNKSRFLKQKHSNNKK